MIYDTSDSTSNQPDMSPNAVSNPTDTPPSDVALVQQIIRKIKDDKRHHRKAFKRMERDMQIAMWGADEDWGEDKYRANIAGRQVKTKTATLYAKNPRITARRRDTLDFAIWDEDPSSLELAYQTAQQAQAIVGQPSQTTVDPNTGQQVTMPPQMPPGADQAQAVIQDFIQGMQRRQFATKYGKTLEVLFSHAMTEQKPLDFKQLLKKVVRRACTSGVGYVELGFQRETGPRPGLTEELTDFRARLDHLQNLGEQFQEGEFGNNDAEMSELSLSIQALQSEPEIVLREGLIFDAPPSRKVIPDRLCTSLEGFIGAGHLTIEYMYTKERVKELFGCDLGDNYSGYSIDDGESGENRPNAVSEENFSAAPRDDAKKQLVCVWKHYDKPSGLVYFIADGYEGFLREPAAPDVFVADFWPVYALTFNAMESEKELYPPSDVSLMFDMQKEFNRSRQGMREHRDAARPRWVTANGSFSDEEDMNNLRSMKPFECVALNMPADGDINKLLQPFPIKGVDPNLYETQEIFNDVQLAVGSQEASFGGIARATATESAIAANGSQSSDGSSIDELDTFLSMLARAGGQILQREMSPQLVSKIVGPGAVWPEMTLEDIADEIYLEIEAGSTGKPNQAVEINNWQRLLPMLIQMPAINPVWLARETLRRLDDKLDLDSAIAAGIPSIVASNNNAQPVPQKPGNAPAAQGPQGGNQIPQPPGQSGSGPAFGSNQTGQGSGHA